MVKEFLIISLLTFVSTSSGAFQGKATKAEVLQYLTSVSGKSTISGQHNREPNSDPTKWTRVVRDITGKNPGLWGGDFLFLNDDVQNRQKMIDEAIRQWNTGSLVALTWHACPPTVGETCDWNSQGVKAHLEDYQWKDLVQEGGQLNKAWKTRIDKIVPFFKQLQSAGVAAIWRPIHEINEGWSWWGGRPGSNGSRKLYQLTYDYMTKYHGLNNLIWAWCVKDVNMGSVDQYWPGSNYVDIATLDVWVNRYSSDSDYQKMLQVASGKPIALGEVGAIPTPDLLNKQGKWVWFMIWSEYLKDSKFNNDNGVKNTYYSPRVLNQGDLMIGGGGSGGSSNLALNHRIKSSTQESSSQGPEKAVDGNSVTRWSSQYSDQQWIYVDLGATRVVKEVKLNWEAAYAKAYQIQISTDESNWRTVYENYNGKGGVESIKFSQAVSARFVKIYAFQRATKYGYSIYEFEVFG